VARAVRGAADLGGGGCCTERHEEEEIRGGLECAARPSGLKPIGLAQRGNKGFDFKIKIFKHFQTEYESNSIRINSNKIFGNIANLEILSFKQRDF
jgi:hypothetical protein